MLSAERSRLAKGANVDDDKKWTSVVNRGGGF